MDAGRVVQLEMRGANQNVTWQSRSVLLPNQQLNFIIGVVISHSQSVNVVYYDSNNALSLDQLSPNLQFNNLPQTISFFA